MQQMLTFEPYNNFLLHCSTCIVVSCQAPWLNWHKTYCTQSDPLLHEETSSLDTPSQVSIVESF